MKYLVGIREIHISTYNIEADNPEDAADKVKDGEDTLIDTEYSDTCEDCISFVDKA
jgi:hypothetical protein